MSHFRTGRISPQEWRNINEATQELSKLDILIDDTPGTTITEMRANARRMLHNKEHAIIILDYLQLVSPPAGRRAESRASRSPRCREPSRSWRRSSRSPSSRCPSSPVRSRAERAARSCPTCANRARSSRTPTSSCSWTARAPSRMRRRRPPDQGITRIVLARELFRPIRRRRPGLPAILDEVLRAQRARGRVGRAAPFAGQIAQIPCEVLVRRTCAYNRNAGGCASMKTIL